MSILSRNPEKGLNAYKLLTFFAIVATFSSCYAQDISLEEKLGPAIKVVRLVTQIETARLKVVSVEDAQNNVLKSKKRITGYPIEKMSGKLNPSDADKIVTLILDSKNYALVRWHCRNRYLLGVRFIRDKELVEFSLGMPCQQAIWAFREHTEVRYWGAVLGSEATQKIVDILTK